MNIWDSLFGEISMTFLVSMVPVIELRGAIPIATAHGLALWLSVPTAIVGNLVPVPFIIIFIRKVFLRLKNGRLKTLVGKLERRASQKSDLVQKYAFWGLFVLVAIPLPGTGAWTGALIAAMLNMRLKRAFPAIALGVAAAGGIVTLVTVSAGTLFFT